MICGARKPKTSDVSRKLEGLLQYSITHEGEWREEKISGDLGLNTFGDKIGKYQKLPRLIRGVRKDVWRVFSWNFKSLREHLLRLLKEYVKSNSVNGEKDQWNIEEISCKTQSTEGKKAYRFDLNGIPKSLIDFFEADRLSDLRKAFSRLTNEKFGQIVTTTLKSAGRCMFFSGADDSIEQPSPPQETSQAPLLVPQK